MTDPYLVADLSIKAFFEEAVQAALQSHELEADPATETYLINLLCQFAKTEASVTREPLGLVLAQARLCEPAQRVNQLKRVGDLALYLTGYFRDHVNRRAVDIEYYSAVGGTAYQRLSQLLRNTGQRSQLASVYTALSSEFPLFSDVLADVRYHNIADDNIGALYESWLEGKSPTIEAKLRRAGVVLPSEPGDTN